MAINLKNPQKKQGALEALKAILAAKDRTFQLDPDEVDQQPEDNKNDKKSPKGQQGQQGQDEKKGQQGEQGQQGDQGEKGQEGQTGEKGQQGQEGQQGGQQSKGQDSDNGTDSGQRQQKGQDQGGGSPGSSKPDKLTVNGLVMPKNSEVKEKDEGPGETEEERQERIAKINDPDQIAQDLADIQADTITKSQQEIKAKKDAAKELARRTNSTLDFEDFADDLFQAVKSQVGVARNSEDTWARPNPTYAGTDYLMPGQDYPDKKIRPKIAVYFDQSHSWGRDDVQKGINAVDVLNGFVAKKKIERIDLYFFSNNLHTNPALDPNADKNNPAEYWDEGGTHGFAQVLQNIAENDYNNVIIMTDDDIDDQTYWNSPSTGWRINPDGSYDSFDVPAPQPMKLRGCVWFIWRYRASKIAPKYLQGERGTFQYKI